jgi:hypothetical protein
MFAGGWTIYMLLFSNGIIEAHSSFLTTKAHYTPMPQMVYTNNRVQNNTSAGCILE